MKGTAYEGVTIRQLLQMSSGVDWNEDYRDPLSSFTSMYEAIADGTEGGIIEVMSNLTRSEIPGKKFLYSSGESYLEGKVLKAALGNESLSGFLSRKIWANMGMESDGYWLLESQDGDEFGGGNLSMTLRDYGRFGLFIQNNGMVNGISVLPPYWVAEASHPASDSPQCNYGELYSSFNNYPYPYYYPLGYGYNWWPMPETAWGGWDYLNDPDWWGTDAIQPSAANFTNLEGSFTAQGVFGQFIHINQKEKVVSIIWSAWKDPWIDPKEYEAYSFINAATGLLH
jgi:CubicO group peptidase (beta-lactamase class C family)